MEMESTSKQDTKNNDVNANVEVVLIPTSSEHSNTTNQSWTIQKVVDCIIITMVYTSIAYMLPLFYFLLGWIVCNLETQSCRNEEYPIGPRMSSDYFGNIITQCCKTNADFLLKDCIPSTLEKCSSYESRGQNLIYVSIGGACWLAILFTVVALRYRFISRNFGDGYLSF